MRIEPSETEIVGEWILVEDRVVATEACARIQRLVTSHLRRLGDADGGWSTLFRDPNDDRFWEPWHR